jgi:predicted ArsR family transcriptional regulator
VVLELTARVFDLGGGEADEVARRWQVARCLLDTMLVASAGELASTFGWPRAAARAALEELVERGEAVGEAGSYRPCA